MGITKIRLAVALAITACLSVQSMAKRQGGSSESVASISGSKRLSVEKAVAIRTMYDASLANEITRMHGVDAQRVRELFHDLETASFFAQTADYPSRKIYLDGMGRVLVEMRRRELTVDTEVDAYYEALIVSRDFSRAEALVAAFPGHDFYDYSHFKPASKSAPQSGPHGYVGRPGGKLELVPVSLPTSGGYAVVVIGCHFAEEAARAIRANSVLADALKRSRVYWLISGAELDETLLRDWNRDFPEFPAMISFDNAAWKDIDFTAMPGFSFYRDGQRVAAFTGWDPKASEAEMLKAVVLAGMTPTSAETNVD